jgi:16S rRNA (uracil1498-N3)-methyltransferase
LTIISERCIKRPDKDKKDNKTERLERIAHEAAKQCGRSRLPSVSPPISFRELISRIKDHDIALFCYEGNCAASLKETLSQRNIPANIAVIVGSEGGFSEREAAECKDAGALTVNLGPRILRCETAPDYCLSAISYVFELR